MTFVCICCCCCCYLLSGPNSRPSAEDQRFYDLLLTRPHSALLCICESLRGWIQRQPRVVQTRTVQLTKALHYGLDLVLVSTCLAGVRRNTGLTLKLDTFENSTARRYTAKYLNVGESCYDYTVASVASSAYFERK